MGNIRGGMKGLQEGATEVNESSDPIMRWLQEKLGSPKATPPAPINTMPSQPRMSMNDVSQPQAETPEEQALRFANLKKMLGQA